MLKSIFRITFAVLTISGVLSWNVLIAAQDSVALQCGDIVEAEFTRANVTQTYDVSLSAGDQIDIEFQPLGTSLSADLKLVDPSRIEIAQTSSEVPGENLMLFSVVVSQSGIYMVQVKNEQSMGGYTLSIGCTIRDGTVISPGDIPSISDNGQPDEGVAFSGFGFPGLPPVDFSDSVTIPIQFDVPMTGAISPGFQGAFGFTFHASGGDTANVTFSKLSGNLNLGLVVLGSDSQTIFQSSLVLSTEVNTKMVFDTDDEYTIGIFNINLIPPDNPERTVFEVLLELEES